MALVGLLKITVPADIYSSSIIVEVSGIRVKIRLLDNTSELERPHPSQKHLPTRKARYMNSDIHRSSSDGESDTLPTPHDLAKSFLEQEPAKEKAELEAEIASHSMDLQQSTVTSEGSEDEPGYGNGVSFALPTFLTGFLKGIRERLQLKINDVLFNLELDIENPPEEQWIPSADDKMTAIMLGLRIKTIDLERVPSALPNISIQSPETKRAGNGPSLRCAEHSVDKITLGCLRLFLCAPNGTAKSTGESKKGQCGSDEEFSPVHSWSQTKDRLGKSALGPRRHCDESQNPPAPVGADGNSPQAMVDSDSSINRGNMTDIDKFMDTNEPSSMYRSELAREIGDDQDVLRADVPSVNLNSSLEAFSHPHRSELDTLRFLPEERGLESASGIAPANSRPRTPSHPNYQRDLRSSSLSARIPGGYCTDVLQDGNQHSAFEAKEASSTASSCGLGPAMNSGLDRDLVESTMFTREDAESIYMSVVDQNEKDEPYQQRMPGEWAGGITESLNSPDQGITPHSDYPATNIKRIPSLGVSEATGRLPTPREDRTHRRELRKHPAMPKSKDVDPRSTAHGQRNIEEDGKELLSIDEIELYLPTSDMDHRNRNAEEEADFRPQSSYRSTAHERPSPNEEVPGAFSLYAETVAFERRPTSTIIYPNDQLKGQGPAMKSPNHLSSSQPCSLIDVMIGSIAGKVDLSTLKPLARIVMKLNSQLIPASDQTNSQANTSTSVKQRSQRSVNVSMKSLNVGIHDYPEIQKRSTSDAMQVDSSASPINKTLKPLFDIVVSNARLSFQTDSSNYDISLDLGKTQLNVASKNAIWFDNNAQMITSARSYREQLDRDVAISLKSLESTRHVTIQTRPIIVDLDFYCLDEALASFGGFSGLLEIGSSMLSDNVPVSKSPTAASNRLRTIRFKTPAEDVKSSSEPSERQKSKLNVQINSSCIHLKVRDRGMKLQSSSIRVISREAGFGIQVSQMKLSGPTLDGQISPHCVDTNIYNFSLRYHFSPEEGDLTRLLSLLTPSNDKFQEDDDFLVDTLVRQRRNGAVGRLKISKADLVVSDTDALNILTELASEVAKMSSFTKYMPQETRPGVLILSMVEEANITIQQAPRMGHLFLHIKACELAYVSVPSLLATTIDNFELQRNREELILHPVVSQESLIRYPMLMARIIGEELEPTVKVKLWNVCFEYNVPLMIALLRSSEPTDREDMRINLATSIANVKDDSKISRTTSQSSSEPGKSMLDIKTLITDISLRDCALGLTPRDLPSKCLFVLTTASLSGKAPRNQDLYINVEIRKAAMLLTNDARSCESMEDPLQEEHLKRPSSVESRQISDLNRRGFVTVSWISAASAQIRSQAGDHARALEIEVHDELFVLETCADSMQTLTELFGALSPPTPPSQGERYRTEIAPVEDMMASFTGDAFAVIPEKSSTPVDEQDETEEAVELGADVTDFGAMADMEDDLEYGEPEEGEDLYGPNDLFDSVVKSDVQEDQVSNDDLFFGEQSDIVGDPFEPSHLPPRVEGIASKWNSTTNRYIPVTKMELDESPLRVRLKDFHIIWNLHDGYDWQKTREALSKAVDDVEAKAEEQLSRRRTSRDAEEEEDSVIGDCLFNSIYIGIPVNHDPRELSKHINKEVDDLVTETGSQTTGTTARPLTAQPSRRPHRRKLKLERSKRQKLSIELRGASVDFFVYPPGGETSSSADIKVRDLDVYDHVSTSTWKKFATYMQDAGLREDKKPMVRLEICEVRPVPELTASELVIRVRSLLLAFATKLISYRRPCFRYVYMSTKIHWTSWQDSSTFTMDPLKAILRRESNLICSVSK